MGIMDTTSSASVPPTPPPKQRINWGYQVQQYGAAIFAAMPVFAAISLYVFFRRGYYDLFIANKAFAGVAAVLLGIVLLIGTGSRLFSFPDRFVQYRKELGIVAALFALTHVTMSLFFLPSRFPLSRYFSPWNWPFWFGLTAILVLIGLFAISNTPAMTALKRKWWPIQYWGMRTAFLLILLHMFVMKWGSWVQWYREGGAANLVHPEWPGAGLLAGWFMTFVVLIRLSEIPGQRWARVVWYTSSAALPAVFIATFLWGRQFIS